MTTCLVNRTWCLFCLHFPADDNDSVSAHQSPFRKHLITLQQGVTVCSSQYWLVLVRPGLLPKKPIFFLMHLFITFVGHFEASVLNGDCFIKS